MKQNILKILLSFSAGLFVAQIIFAQTGNNLKAQTDYKVTFMELGSVLCIPC